MKRVFTAILGLLLLISYSGNGQYKTSSVLSTGTWYKINISQSGIHKIDYTFLKNMGLNPDNIDPRKLHIYGNGGGMLPQNNSTARIDDLAENAIYIKGEDDGKFNSGDYILFYGQGPDTWTYNSSTGLYNHTKNIYSDVASYFITINGSTGLRVADNTSSTLSSSGAATTFTDRQFYENDKINILSSGREWYGDRFDAVPSQGATFGVEGLVSNSIIKLTLAAAVVPSVYNYTYFKTAVNSKSIGSMAVFGFSSCVNCQIGTNASTTYSISTSDLSTPNSLAVNVTYDNKSTDANAAGYLNYIEINALRNLQLYGSQTAFRLAGDTLFKMSGTKSGSIVWDVTTPIAPVLKGKNNNGEIVCSSNQSSRPEFVVFTPDEVSLAPTYAGQTPNQNLHALATPSLIIVTHSSLLEQAQKLAQYRESQGISVAVVTTDQIYNEFSSGVQDITAIRDFCRMLYKKGPLDNLLLFGSCSYDYKDRVSNNSNLVPCYESRESLHDIYSMSSEDYYAFYGDNEGDWIENDSPTYNYQMKIGIGRLPVRNATEAGAVVNKLILYGSQKAFGKWRNKITFMADNDGNSFLSDAEGLVNLVKSRSQTANIGKIYIDAYALVSTPSGNKASNATEALRNTVNQGALLLNYSGHGGELILAQEELLTIPDIKSWSNTYKLPFFVTATCDFSIYDNPAVVSGGMTFLLQAKGGGIGLLTSTRPVFQNTNNLLNQAFFQTVFTRDNTGFYPLMGQVLKNTKNSSVNGRNNRCYTLLGDPSMRLAYPSYSAVVTKINGNAVNLATDTLKALSVISLEGEVYMPGSTVTATNFNGTLYCDIYDKYSTETTLGQAAGATPVNFNIQNSVLYSGQTSVSSGKFSLSFVVPKDINYLMGNGKISLYAYDPSNLIDASGFKNDIIVGGSNPTAVIDTIPPLITLFLNDTTFKNGQITGNTPTLLAHLYDVNGINIARSSIGHELTVTLTDNGNPVILNDFYTSSANGYSSGAVEYPFDSLSEGYHKLVFKAWDTYNNSSEASLEFVVASSQQIAIKNLLNYPNPAGEQTTFSFEHNKAGEDLSVHILIYDRMGKLVKEINEDIVSAQSTVGLEWNIKPGADYNIAAGMYVYKCVVTSKTGGSQTQAIEKLVLIY